MKLINLQQHIRIRMIFSRIFSIAVLFAFNNISFAQDAGIKKDGLMGYFATMCMQNLMNLEKLRTTIIEKEVPRLPDEKAKFFLNEQPGDAWPLPESGKLGNLVMALPHNKNICSVHSRRINKYEVERQFEMMVSNAPKPLTAVLKSNDERDIATGGKLRTISYVWNIPGANRRLLFLLTTSDSETTNVQGLVSASIIDD